LRRRRYSKRRFNLGDARGANAPPVFFHKGVASLVNNVCIWGESGGKGVCMLRTGSEKS